MSTDILDLREICTYCHRTLRRHCRARDCRLEHRWCSERLAIDDPFQWTPETQTDGRCNKCNARLEDHYWHEPLNIIIAGVQIASGGNLTLLVPSRFTGCPRQRIAWF